MSAAVKRGVAAGGTVVVAAAVNITTGTLTQHWAVAWWAATGIVVGLGVGLQIWLTVTEHKQPMVLSTQSTHPARGTLTASTRGHSSPIFNIPDNSGTVTINPSLSIPSQADDGSDVL
jgi:hypothetical protein